MPNAKYDFFLLSKFRDSLFGFAILCVMVFHSGIWIPPSWPILSAFQKNSQFGVDVFLFLSGIGLYFSYINDKNITSFYKKRFKRILPAYIPITCLWFAYNFSWPYQGRGTLFHDIITFCENITLISFWTKGVLTGWFVALILILYILYPFIYSITNLLKIRGVVVLCIMFFCLSCGLIYFITQHRGGLSEYAWIEIVLPRIPIFIFGCWIAPNVKNNKKIGIGLVYLCAAGCVVCSFLLVCEPFFLSHLVFRRFLYGPLAACMSILLSFIFGQVGEGSFLRPLEWLGRYTLEIYLFHEKILWAVRKIFPQQNYFLNIIAICVTLLIVPIYKRIYTKLLNFSLWLYHKCSSGFHGQMKCTCNTRFEEK